MEERLVFELCQVTVIVLSGCTLKCDVDRTTCQVSDEGDGPIDVIAEGLEDFACLRLRHHRVLLIAAIEGEVDVLLWIVRHLVRLTLVQLDQVAADLDYDVFHLREVGVGQLFVG